MDAEHPPDEPGGERTIETVTDREQIHAIIREHLKETIYSHLRSVQNNSTDALEDALVRYCEDIRAETGPGHFTVTAPPGFFPKGTEIAFTPNLPGVSP